MTTNGDNGEMLAALQRLLDAWGGDTNRWPPDVRRQIEDLVRRLPHADRMLAQSRAIDRALDMAQDRPADVASGLVDRIVMTATDVDRHRALSVAPEATAGGAQVIPLRPRAAESPVTVRTQTPNPVLSRGGWQAAALMAASLIAGIYLGGSLNLAPTLHDIAATLGVSAELEGGEMALGEDLADGDIL